MSRSSNIYLTSTRPWLLSADLYLKFLICNSRLWNYVIYVSCFSQDECEQTHQQISLFLFIFILPFSPVLCFVFGIYKIFIYYYRKWRHGAVPRPTGVLRVPCISGDRIPHTGSKGSQILVQATGTSG